MRDHSLSRLTRRGKMQSSVSTSTVSGQDTGIMAGTGTGVDGHTQTSTYTLVRNISQPLPPLPPPPPSQDDPSADISRVNVHTTPASELTTSTSTSSALAVPVNVSVSVSAPAPASTSAPMITSALPSLPLVRDSPSPPLPPPPHSNALRSRPVPGLGRMDIDPSGLMPIPGAGHTLSELIINLSSLDQNIQKTAVHALAQRIGTNATAADDFINEGGLPRLAHLTLHANGTSLAYSLSFLNNLLNLDRGWDYITPELLSRVTLLVVTLPFDSYLRPCIGIIYAILVKPDRGFRELKPFILRHGQFFEKLLAGISRGDHALYKKALSLINVYIRDSLTYEPVSDWSRLVKRLHELGIIRAIYSLMNDPDYINKLLNPLLEFQSLTKKILCKWRHIRVSMDNSEHRRILKSIATASQASLMASTATATTPSTPFTPILPLSSPLQKFDPSTNVGDVANLTAPPLPDQWKRIGFESESPSNEFSRIGYLGLMDLADFVHINKDMYQKLLLEQASKPAEQRCPIAKASKAVSRILYDEFRVNKVVGTEHSHHASPKYALDHPGKTYDEVPPNTRTIDSVNATSTEQTSSAVRHDNSASLHVNEPKDVDPSANNCSMSHDDQILCPLLLHWSRLHTALLNVFFRLWASTGATTNEFAKVNKLVRILVRHVVLRERSNVDSHTSHYHAAGGSSNVTFSKPTRKYHVTLDHPTKNTAPRYNNRSPSISEPANDDIPLPAIPQGQENLRQVDVAQVERELAEADYEQLRNLQMQLIERKYKRTWGSHLTFVREELDHEAVQFIREQRTRCLLEGAWFHRVLSEPTTNMIMNSGPRVWRYVRLAPDRRTLHYYDFDAQEYKEWNKVSIEGVSRVRGLKRPVMHGPDIKDLPRKIDLLCVSSVVSNVSHKPIKAKDAIPVTITTASEKSSRDRLYPGTLYDIISPKDDQTCTRLILHGTPNNSDRQISDSFNPTGGGIGNTATWADDPSQITDAAVVNTGEVALLTLDCTSRILASEWLDGLLMILNQKPVTAQTNRLIDLISNFGMRIRLLNVRFDQTNSTSDDSKQPDDMTNNHDNELSPKRSSSRQARVKPILPSREGIDNEEFYYNVDESFEERWPTQPPTYKGNATQ